MKVYSGLNQIPRGNASSVLTPGCIVLEGGAWRGIYTQGVLDVLMQEDINFQTTIGVSAGALSGYNYVTGQIGRSAHFNLSHRQNTNYCGVGALYHDKGITGFSYLWKTMQDEDPEDTEAFNNPNRRFVVTATNCYTGRNEFFEKGKCDIQTAVQASATVPYVSLPVWMEGKPYLDGGVACKIPVLWALSQGFQKIVVVRTRDKAYRKPVPKKPLIVNRLEYSRYPMFQKDLDEESVEYNKLLNHIDEWEKEGLIYVIAPSVPVTVSRFESDMEKLGALYELGREDAKKQLASLKKYLKK